MTSTASSRRWPALACEFACVGACSPWDAWHASGSATRKSVLWNEEAPFLYSVAGNGDDWPCHSTEGVPSVALDRCVCALELNRVCVSSAVGQSVHLPWRSRECAPAVPRHRLVHCALPCCPLCKPIFWPWMLELEQSLACARLGCVLPGVRALAPLQSHAHTGRDSRMVHVLLSSRATSTRGLREPQMVSTVSQAVAHKAASPSLRGAQ